MVRHEEEGSGKLESGYLGESLWISARGRSKAGRPERRPLRRKISRGRRSEGGPPPLQLPESQREVSIRILNAYPLSGKT